MSYLFPAESGASGKTRKEENYIFESKSNRGGGEHPAPEAGKCLPWKFIVEYKHLQTHISDFGKQKSPLNDMLFYRCYS